MRAVNRFSLNFSYRVGVLHRGSLLQTWFGNDFQVRVLLWTEKGVQSLIDGSCHHPEHSLRTLVPRESAPNIQQGELAADAGCIEEELRGELKGILVRHRSLTTTAHMEAAQTKEGYYMKHAKVKEV